MSSIKVRVCCGSYIYKEIKDHLDVTIKDKLRIQAGNLLRRGRINLPDKSPNKK